jgi:RNA-binding protein
MQLTERQKKYLRREAHSLKPVVSAGDKGISPAVLGEIERALEHHELIKIKVRIGDRDARNAAIAEMVDTTGATLVSRVGNIAAIYRPRNEDPGIVLPKAGK